MRKLKTQAWILILLLCFPTAGQSIEIVTPSGVSPDRVATEVLWRSVRRLPKEERPKIVLVLGGGGARGLSHIGVLRVFEQEQVPIDRIVGISIGALIGSLYAGGLSPSTIDRMSQEVGWNSLTDMNSPGILSLILKEELLSTKRMETYLESHLGRKQFEDLSIPFVCIATDLYTGERVVFDRGPLAVAARASATIPGFFTPVKYQQRYLVDGGLSDVLPMDLAAEDDWSITIGILPTSDEEKQQVEQPSVLRALVRSLEIQTQVRIEEKKNRADFIIEPNVGSMGFLDVNQGEKAIQAGTQAARANMLELKKLILRRVIEKKRRVVGER